MNEKYSSIEQIRSIKCNWIFNYNYKNTINFIINFSNKATEHPVTLLTNWIKVISEYSSQANIVGYKLEIEYEFVQENVAKKAKWFCNIKIGEIVFESRTCFERKNDAKAYAALTILYKLGFFHPNRHDTFKSKTFEKK